MSKSSENQNIRCGDRIQYDTHVGTVRYIGPIDDKSGEWIGIEWDDKNKGKHDGCVGDKRYFTTKHPKSGSFVRSHNLQTGISFMEALKSRYADHYTVSDDLLNLPQKSQTDRSIEFIGFDKVSRMQRNFEQLVEINLSEMKIAYCDNSDINCTEIPNALKCAKTMILSKNLFSCWYEIAKIVEKIPSLNDLVLSYNKLELPSANDKIYLMNCFKSLKSLIIDNMEYDWNNIEFCASLMWPTIERLDLWGNNITVINEPRFPVFSEIKYLSLNYNNIVSWNHICRLGTLANLQTLHISNCSLSEVRFENTHYSAKVSIFKELRTLMISDNDLQTWRDISELNKLEKLEDLFIKNNPVFNNETYDINFNLILARIGNLKYLNREQITDAIRREAEIYYLRKIYREYLSVSRNDDQHVSLDNFMLDNPRYKSILSKYGSPTECEIDPKLEMEKRKFLNIVIVNPFDSSEMKKRKLPANISIMNVKTIIRRLFNVDFNNDISLIWKSKEFECALEKDEQNLNFYAIENGDFIIVNLVS